MPRDFSKEQEGLVAVTIKSFSWKTFESRPGDCLVLQLSDGGTVYIHNSLSRLSLMRQTDRHSAGEYPVRDQESIVKHIIETAMPIIVQRKIRYTHGSEPVWDHKIPTDMDLLCGQ